MPKNQPLFLPKLRPDQVVSVLLICCLCLVQSGKVQAGAPISVDQKKLQLATDFAQIPQLVKATDVPIFIGSPEDEEKLATLSAVSVYVMDRHSGSVLYKKDSVALRSPASTAKMMTALVARKYYGLDKHFTVGQEAYATGTTAGLFVGEELTTKEVLASLLISSGNDAALLFADAFPSGYDGFIQAMNDLAKELHLTWTEFRNSSGLDSELQMSTARDLAILANEVLKDDVLKQLVRTKQYSFHDVSGKYTHTLTNTNLLLDKVDGVIGVKTGTTESAGENLILGVNRQGQELIMVILGSQDRYQDAERLIKWVFENYQWKGVN